jgi:hypothetical protein
VTPIYLPFIGAKVERRKSGFGTDLKRRRSGGKRKAPKETGDIAFVMMRLQVRFFSEFCANMYMEGESRI